jgi:deoxyribodipyrimidine photo-lyase
LTLSIVWFRQDLRLHDNPALAAAAARGRVIPLYILDDVTSGAWRAGAASRWWLHHSLTRLQQTLGGLVYVRGDPRELLPALVKRAGATAVFWNRCYEPAAIARDRTIKAALQAVGIDAHSFNASLLHEPWEVATQSGDPFKVYTPYWRAALRLPVAAPMAAASPTLDLSRLTGDALEDYELLPTKPNWAQGWDKIWKPGEDGAWRRLEAFVNEDLAAYSRRRDRPDVTSTSRLSPHLHFGEISPRQIWARLAYAEEDSKNRQGAEKFSAEIGWREFCHHLLYHYPTLPEQNWRAVFDTFPWRDSPTDLAAWQKGLTGYPLVDAGMRELWQTGWMHNRVRMIAASFLVKHLRLDWRLGEAWFWDTLVDADLANNAAGWQWVAGSGADAAPYFRIFNPVLQGRKFDPEGAYVRKWCPELRALPNDLIHAPFMAPADALASAGIALGRTYPKPVVDHKLARDAALSAYQAITAK